MEANVSERVLYAVTMALYLGVMISIGIVVGRRIRRVEDFYLGGRNVGAWVTALSFVSAYFSSVVIIGGGAFGYLYGMATLWIGAINVLVGCTLCWIVMGRRVREFTARLKTMTIPGFLAERFRNPEARVFSGTIIFLFMVIYNVSILKAMAHLFEVLMQIPYMWGVLLSGLIIVLYVGIGGYLAVVWTGFLQTWVMGAGLILLASRAVHAMGGLEAANQALAAIDPGLVSTPGVWGWAGLVSYALIVSYGVWGMPQLVVRFYSIRSTSVLRLGTVLVTLGGSLALLPYLSGAIARVLHPGLANADLAIPTLMRSVLPPSGRALFLAAVASAGMSTFSAVLIIVTSSLVHDVWEKGLGKHLEERKALRANRWVSTAVGIVSLGIALKPPGLVLTLCAFSWAVIAATCLWPLVLGLYWRRATRWGCTAAMVGGCVASLAWMAAGRPFGIHGFIPGIGVSLVLLVVVSLLTPRLPKDHIATIWNKENRG
jgi:SSS family solute:Na+ symporter